MAIKTGQGMDATVCFFSEASNDIDALVFSSDKMLNYTPLGNAVYGQFGFECELLQDDNELNTFLTTYASEVVAPVDETLINGIKETISSPNPDATQLFATSKGNSVAGQAPITAVYSQVSFEYLQSASGTANKVKLIVTGVDAGTTKTLTATTINAQYDDITLSDGDLTINPGKKGTRIFTTVS